MEPSHPQSSSNRQLREAADAVLSRSGVPPRVVIILGTGLGGLADRVANPTHIPYAEIPHFPTATVVGHAGRLVLGELRGVPVAAMQGRFHLYEGHSPQQVVFPLRVLRSLGAQTLIVTNAAGGLAAGQHAGDLMLIRDHIGLATMMGQNPLIGPNDDALGPRFPPMTDAYPAELRALAQSVAGELGMTLSEGVYVMVTGPNYETPAELRYLRLAGADAVGMSTVPEVLAAVHMGMRVLAVSCITNVALGGEEGQEGETSHLDVVRAAEEAGGRLAALIEGVLARM